MMAPPIQGVNVAPTPPVGSAWAGAPSSGSCHSPGADRRTLSSWPRFFRPPYLFTLGNKILCSIFKFIKSEFYHF